jgi:imidazolonepropionase-like amidohydrolase
MPTAALLALLPLLAPDSAAAPCLPPDSARGAVRYTVVTAAARPSGCLLVWRESPNAARAFFTFNDRGRGPRTTARWALDADGRPRSLDVAGADYLRAPVDEHFALGAAPPGRRARWRSTTERDSAAVPAAGAAPFYLSMGAPPLEDGLLAAAALRAGTAGVALLPTGRAYAERVRDTVLTDSAGRAARATLVAVRGVAFAPSPVWLDSAGALFASGSAWSMTVRAGYEGAVGALDRAQRAWSAARDGALARRLARRPAGGVLVVRGARLFDAEAMAMRERVTVVVRGDRVARVAPDSAVGPGDVPAGATVVDAGGRALLPGLWDMHVHADAGSGIFFLAAGVTTVRDLGNDWTLPETGRRWARGDALGPRLLMSGFLDGPGPYTGPTGAVAATLPEALAAVDRYADSGYVQVKLYSSLDTAFVRPVAERAHARGLRVSGHVPQGMTAERFVRAGADEVQHANFLLLNFLGDSAGDTRTPARFTAPARLGALVDVRADSVRRFVALLRERGAVSDPTLNVFEEMFTGRPGVLAPAWAPVLDRMPPQVQRGLRAGGGGLPVPASPAGMDARYRASFATMQALVKALYDAGVRVVAGTDAAPGWSLHRELELYAEAGIPAPAVLRLATLGAAEVMRRERDLGSVAEGKLADFVLVDGDPATRVSDLRRTWLVVKGGVAYRPDELYAELGVAPRAAGAAATR